MEAIVLAEAPRLFAIVEEFDDGDDGPVAGWVTAWGMAFDGYTEVVVPHGARMSVGTPQDALQLLSLGGVDARLVWLGPAA